MKRVFDQLKEDDFLYKTRAASKELHQTLILTLTMTLTMTLALTRTLIEGSEPDECSIRRVCYVSSDDEPIHGVHHHL